MAVYCYVAVNILESGGTQAAGAWWCLMRRD